MMGHGQRALRIAQPGRDLGRAKAAATSGATDLRARGIFRDRPAYAGYPNSPTYFARPYYYRPYPYGVPVPFFLGFAYLPYY